MIFFFLDEKCISQVILIFLVFYDSVCSSLFPIGYSNNKISNYDKKLETLFKIQKTGCLNSSFNMIDCQIIIMCFFFLNFNEL